MKAKTFRIVTFSVVGVLLAIILAVNVALSFFGDTLIRLFSGSNLDSASREAGESLALQIAEEGCVLVKNEDNTLPLDPNTDTKVSVFGWAATQWIMSGSGSGRATNGSKLTPETDFLKALTEAGIEYDTGLIDMYRNYYDKERPYQTDTLHGYDWETCRLIEPAMSEYPADVLATAEQNDVAIVVLGRVSGESTDCPLVQYKGTAVSQVAQDTTRTYLDISTEEEALLTYVGEKFDKVIVVINSTNAMNLGFMDGIVGLDSCLVSGGLGNNAVKGLVNLIYGQKMYEGDDYGDPVSPSGRLTDTYVYDFKTNASFANTGTQGIGAYSNASGLYPIGEKNGNFHDNPTFKQVSYLDYQEDIYVGYKWYETADKEGFWTSDYAKNTLKVNGYDEVVQYPFGYGLSYTTFEWDIVERVPTTTIDFDNVNEEMSIVVSVKNVGEVAAQEVVELYYTPSESKSGIEKAEVNLLAFAKTPVPVEPGESQELTLTFKPGDMGSYDAYEKIVEGGGWVMESGEYTLSLRTDAHTPAEGVSTIVMNCPKDLVRYDPESASNLFTGDEAKDYGVSVDGKNSDANITYLSRTNKFADFPEATENKTRAMADSVKALNKYTDAHVKAWNDAHADAVMPTMGAAQTYKLFGAQVGKGDDVSVDESKAGTLATSIGLALGEDYEDETWEEVLDQLTESEMKELALHGYIHEEAVPSVNKAETVSLDGPSEYASFNVSTGIGIGYPNPSVLAQTWNQELAKSFGLSVATEVINTQRQGWYAPGVNLHRSAFGGRNYEYYSEDSLLSGVMGSKVVEGSLCAGVYVYVKHIIGYDQETARDSLYCWMTEQNLRETYLKPFKIIIDKSAHIKIGDEEYHGTPGLMTAYGRIGAVWSGGSEALIGNLLRDEWNYQGAIISDYADHKTFMNADQMIRAGANLWMDGVDKGNWQKENSSAAFLSQLRESTHQVLYTILNAQYINSNYNESADQPVISKGGAQFPLWTIVGVVDAVVIAGCAVWVFFAIRKKDKVAPAAQEGTDETPETPDTPDESSSEQ